MRRSTLYTLLLFTAMFIVGIVLAEYIQVKINATLLCFSCIGIG